MDVRWSVIVLLAINGIRTDKPVFLSMMKTLNFRTTLSMTLAMIMELSSANQGTLHVDVLVQKMWKFVGILAILNVQNKFQHMGVNFISFQSEKEIHANVMKKSFVRMAEWRGPLVCGIVNPVQVFVQRDLSTMN